MPPSRKPLPMLSQAGRSFIILLASLAVLLAPACAPRNASSSMAEDTLVVSPTPPLVLRVDKEFVYVGEVSIGPETTGEPLGLSLEEQVFFDVDQRGRVTRALTIGTMLPPEGASFNELIWVPAEQLVYGGEVFGGLDFRGRTVAVPVDETFYLRQQAGLSGYSFPDLLLVRELGLLVDDAGVFLISYAEAVDGALEDWESVNALDDERTSQVLTISKRLQGSIQAVEPSEGLPGETPTEESGDQEPPAGPACYPSHDPAFSPI